MHVFDRHTDRRTDRILIARPRLHSMQHGKNAKKTKTNTNPNPTTNHNPKPTIDKAAMLKELNKVP